MGAIVNFSNYGSFCLALYQAKSILLIRKVYIFDCAFDNDFINFQGHFQVNYYEINDFFTDILIYIRNGDMIGVLLYTLALFFVFSVLDYTRTYFLGLVYCTFCPDND